MVELINHDYIKGGGIHRPHVLLVEGLHRREDMLPPGGSLPVYEKLAERTVLKNIPVCAECLLEDLFPMGDKQESRPASACGHHEVAVVEGGNHCLPCPRGRD